MAANLAVLVLVTRAVLARSVFRAVGVDHHRVLCVRRRHAGLGLFLLGLFDVLAGFAHALGHLIILEVATIRLA